MPTTQDTAGDLQRLVHATRRRMRLYWTLTGVGLVVAAAAVALLLAAALDVMLAMSVGGRLASLVAVAVLTGVAVLLAVIWPIARPLHVNQVALRIEQAVGGIHNRLITLLDLLRGGGRVDTTEPFVQRVVTQTRDKLDGYHPHNVADPRPARRSLAVGAGVVLGVVALVLLFSPRLSTAVARIVQPTASIAPATGTRLVAPGDLNTLQGEPLTIDATTDGRAIEELTFRMRPVGGEWRDLAMRRQDDTSYTLELTGLDADCEYQLVGGGTWSDVYGIAVARRPIVTSLQATVHQPDYLNDDTAQVIPHDADEASAVIGSRLALRAQVTDDATRGELRVYRATTRPTGRTVTREIVWVDDEVPADAALVGKWKWTNETAFSGRQSHTFDWQGQPYGFDTRLQPLDAPAGASLFVYVHLDPEEPPQQVTLIVRSGEQSYRLTWGEPEEDVNTANDKAVRIHAGELPSLASGQAWSRLQVPMERLGDSAKTGVKLTGATFTAGQGRVWFDRLGYLTRRPQQIKTTKLDLVRTVEMTRNGDDWSSDIQVTSDAQMSAVFFNRLGHASVPTRPLAVTALADAPPQVAIDRPGKVATLGKAAPVPVMVRANDDFALASIRLQTSIDGQQWRSAATTTTFDEVVTRHYQTLILDTSAMQRGDVLYYRVAARDRKDQITVTAPQRVALGVDPQLADATDEEARYKALADRLNQLADTQKLVDQKMAELMANLPDGVKPFAQNKGGLKNPDGSDVAPKDMQKFLEQFDQALAAEQRQQAAELDALLKKQQQEAGELAGRFDQAASDAKQSPTAAPLSSQVLSSIAQRLQQLAQDRAAMNAGAQSSLQKMQELNAAGDDAAQLAALHKQLMQMLAAHQGLANDPQQVERMMRLLLAKMRAQQAMRQLGGLGGRLEIQRQELSHLAAEATGLRDKTLRADGSALRHLSDLQQGLDPQAFDALMRAKQLLRDRATDATAGPTQRWSPPMRKPDVDLATDGQQRTPQEVADELAKRLAAAQQLDDPDWWDQPLDPEAKQSPSPRDMLAKHQDDLARSLESHGAAGRRTTQQVTQSQGAVGSALDEAQKVAPDAPEADDATRSLIDALSSPQVRALLAMAHRASMQQSQASQQDGDQGSQQGDQTQRTTAKPTYDGQPRAGTIEHMDLDDIDPRSRSAIYRLPPELRRPLLEAMKERGPAAYQPLIDAYFRQLAEQDK